MGISIDDATVEMWRIATTQAAAGNMAEPPNIACINELLSRPWGEVGLALRAYVFLLYQTGKVEIGVGDGLALAPRWLSGHTYQVREVKKPKTKPSIDWSQIKPEYKWLARDSDGDAYVYVQQPHAGNLAWTFELRCVNINVLVSYMPGECDWQDSLVQRPAGV